MWIAAACVLAMAPALGAQTLIKSGGDVSTDPQTDLEQHGKPAAFEAFTNMGFALEGVLGEPILSGTGTMAAGSTNALDLVDARPIAVALLLVSMSNSPTAFKGGKIVPTPAPVQLLLLTDRKGDIHVDFELPALVPGGLDIYMQFVIQDPAAVQLFALSNAISIKTP
jgi:hypothetical protein